MAIKSKPPTIQQLVDIVHEYNVARAHELSQKPNTGWPQGYKNQLMDNLYDAACLASRAIALMQVEPIAVEPRE